MVDQQAGNRSDSGPPVVVLSAVADEIDALRSLLDCFPDKTGLAYVVLPGGPLVDAARLVASIGKFISLPVLTANEQVDLAPDYVYVVAHGQHLDVDGNTLVPGGPGAPATTHVADQFLGSLARAKRGRVTYVLPAKVDGVSALGLADIRQFDGLVVAPDSAAGWLAETPAGLALRGLVDRSLPIEEIPQAISDYLASRQNGDGAGQDLFDDQFIGQVLFHLYNRLGRNFAGYKKGTVSRRISRRMHVNRLSSPAEYLQLLTGSPDEPSQLQKDLLISVTQFFRDPEALRFLASDVIPGLCERVIPDRPIRVWVPGTATGEEAYSLAILVSEALRKAGRQSNIQVFATDIDTDALAVARAGVYQSGIEAHVPPDIMKKYFTREGTVYRIVPAIRDMVTFAEQNVISDPPFSRIDLIVCRNLLIYLEPQLQHRVFGQFNFSLNIHGVLLLGSSETLGRDMGEWFNPVSEKFRVYRKVLGARRMPSRTSAATPVRLDPSEPADRQGQQPSISTVIAKSILDSLPVCSVVVNRELTIQHALGDTSPFLSLPASLPNVQLLSMVKPGVRRAVRALVRQVVEKGAPQGEGTARLKVGSQYREVRLIAKSLRQDERLSGLYQIVFELGQVLPSSTQSNRETNASVAELERELFITRDDLYDAVEQLEAGNEELRTGNEEVTSVIEELESSKEELQSTNEELTTVNLELQASIEDLQDANDDISNLLSSAEVATVFLDSDLRIKRFSKSATEVLNLIGSDVGRPFHHVANDVDGADICLLASDVLQTGRGVQRVVIGPGQRDYMLRIAPYDRTDSTRAGVTISLADVTAIQRSVRQQSLLVELGRLAADRVPLDELFQKAAELLAAGLRVPFTKVLEMMPESDRLLLRAGVGWQDGLVGRVFEPAGTGSQAGYTIDSGGPVVVSDVAEETRFVFPALLVEHGIRAGMTVQIAGYQGRPFGVLGALSDTPRQFDWDAVNFLSTVAAFLGSVVATTREIESRIATEQQLQELTQDLERRVQDRTRQMRMLNVQSSRAEERERQRIAEGLHDDVQQLLAASHYGLQSLLGESGKIAAADLAEIAGWVEQALSATRSFVFDLSPTVLYEEGLGRALEHLSEQMSERHDLAVTVLAPVPVDPIPQGIRVFLYSATRELLFNVVKHAGVDAAEVELSKRGESVRVIVRDRGNGMDLEAPRQSSGVGLASLRERVEYFRGELRIESSVGSGTSVTLALPLSEGLERRRDDPGDHRR